MKANLVVTAVILLCCACKKDKQQGQTNFKNERVKSTSWTGGGQSTYTYDDKKRQVKEASNTGITIEFSYEQGKVIRRVKQTTQTDSFIYELNAEGYVKTLLVPGGITYTYEYTVGGMLAKESSNEPSPFAATHYYNTTTGLQDSIRQTVGGVWYSTAIYTYYTDKGNSLRNENLGLASYGEVFLKPVKRYRSLYKDGSIIKEQITDFTYTYDGKGRIITKTTVSSTGSDTYSYTYY